MPHVLCVAEKPSIAKSIASILSGGQYSTRRSSHKFINNYDFPYHQTNSTFTVTCVCGHLTSHDFFDTHRAWNSCDPFQLFDAPVETKIPPANKPIADNISTESRRADTLMIWTDCDREGENIGLEIVNVARRAKRNIHVKRARFSAIIAQQIHRAAQQPVNLDLAQAAAVDARTTLDLKVGAAFTRLQTLNLRIRLGGENNGVISYGPCQFPTLGFVVSRYLDTKNFRSEKFWYIHLLHSNGTQETPFKWRRGHLYMQDEALVLYEQVLADAVAKVISVSKTETKKWKPLPLTTVELQKAGSRILKMTPKKVLDIAEKLYQQGFVSYPRTETDQYDPQFSFDPLIEKQSVDAQWGEFATSLMQGGFEKPRNGKNNDKAHPPIHPTAHANNLSGDEKRVYEFIVRRFLASCSKDAIGSTTTVDVVCGDEEFFATDNLVVLLRNYLTVYPYDKWNAQDIPDFEDGSTFQPSVCELREGETTKPNLLTEADLVALMDKNGIGTDATIAQHIQTIIEREYVVEKFEGSTKYLAPSTLGIGLIEGYDSLNLEKSFSKPFLRRETERRMVQVCEGAKTKDDMIQESIEEYKAWFITARSGFEKIVTSVKKYTDGAPNPAGNNNNGNDPGPGGRGGGGGGPGPPGGGNGPSYRAPRPPSSAPPPRPGPSQIGTMLPDRRQNQPRNYGEPAVNCRCDVPAARRTVTREGSSKGKDFWCCESSKCGFFQFVDQPSTTPGSTVPAKRPLGINEKKCLCDLQAVQRVSTKDNENKGRTFWTCPNSTDARCKFFEWADETGKSPANNTVPVLSRQGNCFKCGEEGHWAPDCPNQPTAKRRSFGSRSDNLPSGGGSQAGQCFKCNQTGHWAKDCPGGVESTARGRGGRTQRGSTRGTRRGSGSRGSKRGRKKQTYGLPS